MVPTPAAAPMARIAFHAPGALAVFASKAERMAEGWWSDGEHGTAAALTRVAVACRERGAEDHAPLRVAILAEDAGAARAVLATCLSDASGFSVEDGPERETFVFSSDAEIETTWSSGASGDAAEDVGAGLRPTPPA